MSGPQTPSPGLSVSALAYPKKSNHRVWPGKALPIVRGQCRWCGTTIYRADGSINRRKTFCDQRCVKQFLLRTDAKMMRRHCYNFDMGICRGCGEVFDYYEDSGWEADHIIPLYYAAAIGDWTAWDPENLQLLCKACHKDKTRADFLRYGYPPRMPANFIPRAA